MTLFLPKYFQLSTAIREALELKKPIVALETTVITHGLPYPQNIALAQALQRIILGQNVIPAMIGVMAGRIVIGMSDEEVEMLAKQERVAKVSLRDFAPLVTRSGWGGTTVAGTMWAASMAGIRVFATGGIGGVHRSSSGRQTFDVSTDLEALANIPMVVVCAGAKSILDLPATLEVLETKGVPVIGYQTDEFPAFFSRQSGGLKTSATANNPSEIAELAKTHWEMRHQSAILVTVPVPEEDALSYTEMDEYIQQATWEAEQRGVHGQALTPFLLQRLNELSHGASLRANLSLLKNNARVASLIAEEMARETA